MIFKDILCYRLFARWAAPLHLGAGFQAGKNCYLFAGTGTWLLKQSLFSGNNGFVRGIPASFRIPAFKIECVFP